MNLETARQHIAACRELMETLYHRSVFDEWVIVSFKGGRPEVANYSGPREDMYQKSLHADSAALVGVMQDKQYSIGDFEFVQDAAGSSFDACIRLGENHYLLCNYLEGTMADLRKDPRWLKAQAPFVDLTEKFRADPLT